MACLANQAMNYLVSGRAPRRLGNGHPNIVPYRDFPTADGDMILVIGNDGQFARFCDIAGHPEYRLAPPLLGQDTAAVLREIRRSDEASATLRAAGVI